ncbi:MAG: 16S rRNA (guanine(527)-N(7))-methyltransferase RsmG [Tannerellaceae bacterium]|jgi:16S rRNA (guanine527-N7)-methyltransferase|nr:16S rRNA (guanine(527)-N(7))-methyltransferase RsmG [Tannerellaceae bacterium]
MYHPQLSTLLGYFPELDNGQREQLAALNALYAEWNAKINVISRQDIDNLYLHHVLHSLGIVKLICFANNTSVMDIGTGGGFPGIPLAIYFPNVSFKLIDGTGKKIKVATEVAAAIGLKNVNLAQSRAEDEKGQYDFVVSRGVTSLSEQARIVKKNIAAHQHNALPNGLISLKGGEIGHELMPFRKKAISIELAAYFNETYFRSKKVVYIPL